MIDYDETDDRVDMAREHIALVRETTAHEEARIRTMAHNQHVEFGYSDEEDWRRRA